MPKNLISDEELMNRGKGIYGAEAFAQIYSCYLALQPFMSNPRACLEVLASPLERLARGPANEERMQSPGIVTKIGAALVRTLDEYVVRVTDASTVIQVSVESKDLKFQIGEALKAVGFSVRISYPRERPVPTNVGRRVYTGQTEQPGPNPGFRSHPPTPL